MRGRAALQNAVGARVGEGIIPSSDPFRGPPSPTRGEGPGAQAYGSRPAAFGSSAATFMLTILPGARGGSPFGRASTCSMPEATSPHTVYWRSRKVASSKQMKNWLLAEFGFG